MLDQESEPREIYICKAIVQNIPVAIVGVVRTELVGFPRFRMMEARMSGKDGSSYSRSQIYIWKSYALQMAN
jgi:hypothetical protein